KALKQQYAKDMEEQRKKVAAQQAQIQTLQQTARSLEDRLRAQAATPKAPAAQPAQGPDRQQRLLEIQRRQLGVLEEQMGLVAHEPERQGPAIEKLQSQAATLESARGKRPSVTRSSPTSMTRCWMRSTASNATRPGCRPP